MKNTFEMTAWDETNYLEISEEVRFSKASVTKKYNGQLVGLGQLEYIMNYVAKGRASFVGIEHFEGEVDGKKGRVSFEHKGTFVDGIVNSEFVTIQGSGAFALDGFNATGRFTSGHSMLVEFELLVID